MAKIAIFSDSHDHIHNLQQALKQAQDMGVDALLHCGDLCAPFVVKLLGEQCSGPIHLIFGNNDGDGRLTQLLASQFPHITHHGIYGEFDLFGRRIAMIHYPEPARRIAQSGQLDLVCYGHDHTQYRETIGPTLLVNPGEIMGLQHEPTWGLYDTEAHTFQWVSIDAPETP